MSKRGADRGFEPAGTRLSAGRLAMLLFLAASLMLPGCGGCSWWGRAKTPEEIEKERLEAQARLRAQKEKEKPNYEFEPMVAYPHVGKRLGLAYKPGHWITGNLLGKTNHFDVLGEMEITVTDRNDEPMGLVGVPFSLKTSRQAAFRKGQPKVFETSLFIPATLSPPRVRMRLEPREGSRIGAEAPVPLLPAAMPTHQYHLAVLARMPEQYAYVKSLDAVKAPMDLGMSTMERAYYRVVILDSPERTPRIALPWHALYWTTIAYLVWDDVDPDRLLPEQQTALVDWLHWGGQLIVSGPESLDALRNSFLDPYLPATANGARQITATDLAELNARWTLPVRGKPGLPLEPVKPWSGLRLTKDPAAQEVPGTGGLLIERRVGRGRVVVSAFRLAERELRNWPSLDSFFNACLLRRAPRRFYARDVVAAVTWSDCKPPRVMIEEYPMPESVWPADDTTLDPRRVSNLRYFARDTERRAVFAPRTTDGGIGNLAIVDDAELARDPYDPPEFQTDVASWSDFNGVADRARQLLEDSAAIEVPDRSFVMWVVGGYLLVLVPLNWAFFRLIGRVEWAWIAAPIVAVACTAVVIRMARLDIGFARSLSEIAVVEVQGPYRRAHVARYTALYTSLATAYRFRAEDPGVLIHPFPTQGAPTESRFGRTELTFRYGAGAELAGFRVSSNSTGLAHIEQMVDLGGALVLDGNGGGQRVVNRTPHAVYAAGVVRRIDAKQFETAWIGTLAPGASALLRFQPRAMPEREKSFWENERVQARQANGAVAAPPGLDRLLVLAEGAADPNAGGLAPGEVRLVGWSAAALAGLEISPAAPQAKHFDVVLAHLHYDHQAAPEPDLNTRADVDPRKPAVTP